MSTLDRHEFFINGTALDRQKAPIAKIMIDLSVEKADSFSLTISPADELTAGSVDVGDPIEIKIADQNNTSVTVFKGFVTTITEELPEDGDHQVIVEGMDGSFKMMKGIKSRSWAKMKHSDVVSSIIGEHGLTAGTVTATTITYDFLEQNQVSDYQFVSWLAVMNGFEFFVNLGKVYFRKPHQNVTASKTFTWGENIIHLTRTIDLIDQVGEVKVRGYDFKTKQAVLGTSSEVTMVGGSKSKTGKQLLNSAFGTKTDETWSEVISQADAKLQADSIAYYHGSKLVSGRLKVFGDPNIQAGNYVQIEKAGGLNGIYYIVSAVHTLDDDDGYMTEIHLGGTSI
ncbi:MAG: phage late control D family protein [Firmicutes bacterium]|nr:phage late control D family protein [Bacillota bacterium]